MYFDPSVLLKEVVFTPIRAQGNGGQNVNKVSTAVHLRFDIYRSSIPDWLKANLLKLADDRITDGGHIVIKAQSHRSQLKNKEEAVERLILLIEKAAFKPKARKATRPSKSSQRKRLDSKNKQGQKKTTRGRVDY